MSLNLAHKYKAKSNCDIALIEAAALKHLSEQWSTLQADKEFPITLMNKTELIDVERADFFLSLA